MINKDDHRDAMIARSFPARNAKRAQISCPVIYLSRKTSEFPRYISFAAQNASTYAADAPPPRLFVVTDGEVETGQAEIYRRISEIYKLHPLANMGVRVRRKREEGGEGEGVAYLD